MAEPYQFEPYPAVRYHWNKSPVVVHNLEEDAALGRGWTGTPRLFDAYKGPRPPRPDSQMALRWAEQWLVAGLPPQLRARIKLQLLRTDETFWGSPEDAKAVAAMKQAYDGVAGEMAEAGLLTEQLLRSEVSELVWDTAIAAGWWRYGSENEADIFPDKIGHYWIWRGADGDSQDPFRVAQARWSVWLQERATNKSARAGEAFASDSTSGQSALNTDLIKSWMREEGYDNQELAAKLHVSERAVSSLRNNSRFHGRKSVKKLATLMQREDTDLYRQ
jgi:hypothetical protein